MDYTVVRALVATAAILLAPGCAAEGDDVEETDNAFTEAEGLPVGVPRAPLCTTSTRLSLSDAGWMAWFSERAYRHYREFSADLVKAGFGNEDDAETWMAASAKVAKARAEADPDLAQIEMGAIRTPHLDRKLDFFGAGGIEDGKFVHRSTQVTWAQHRTLPIAVITFRGTEPEHIGDVLTDMTSFKMKTDDTNLPGLLHRGFFEGVESVSPLLFARIKAMPAGSRIYVTGHSLGGALATIFTAQLLRDHGTAHAVSLYTFGSPRVGDRAFATAFEASVASSKASATRFHFERDPVVQVPVINYSHTGLPVFLERERFTLDLPETLGLPRLADHAIANYQTALQRAFLQKPAYPMTAQGRAASVSLASASTCAP
jgi:hypothetical protein